MRRRHRAPVVPNDWSALGDPDSDPCRRCGAFDCAHCRYCGEPCDPHRPECPWETGLWPITRAHEGTACARCASEFAPGDSFVSVAAHPSEGWDSEHIAVCLACGLRAVL